jgi:hypothetical protein
MDIIVTMTAASTTHTVLRVIPTAREAFARNLVILHESSGLSTCRPRYKVSQKMVMFAGAHYSKLRTWYIQLLSLNSLALALRSPDATFITRWSYSSLRKDHMNELSQCPRLENQFV